MAFAPISLTIFQYDELTYAGWWLKAYEEGTVTPLVMATDATGATTLAKCLLDSEGFPITSATGPKFIPFINGSYDLWLFPTEGEADGDLTTNAIQLADDLNADPDTTGSKFLDAVTPLTANTTIALTHKNEIVDCTNTITLTFTAAATLGAGFAFVARNKGSGVITCDADGSETINGALTLILGPGEWAIFIDDGTNWSAVVGSTLGGRWVKGADVVSTGAMTLGSDGNYFDITGTNAITSIVTRGVTGAIKLHFDGILAFTHHATNLIMPGGATITTAAGDECELIEYGAGTYRVTNYQRAAFPPVEPFSFRGCLVYLDANQTISNSSSTEIAFDQESYDTDSIHDNVTNNDRLTVPTGVTKVKISFKLSFAANATGTRSVVVHKNGSHLYTGYINDVDSNPHATNPSEMQANSPAITVVATDYFTFKALQDSGGNLDVTGEASGFSSWFSMEIIE